MARVHGPSLVNALVSEYQELRETLKSWERNYLLRYRQKPVPAAIRELPVKSAYRRYRQLKAMVGPLVRGGPLQSAAAAASLVPATLVGDDLPAAPAPQHEGWDWATAALEGAGSEAATLLDGGVESSIPATAPPASQPRGSAVDAPQSEWLAGSGLLFDSPPRPPSPAAAAVIPAALVAAADSGPVAASPAVSPSRKRKRTPEHVSATASAPETYPLASTATAPEQELAQEQVPEPEPPRHRPVKRARTLGLASSSGGSFSADQRMHVTVDAAAAPGRTGFAVYFGRDDPRNAAFLTAYSALDRDAEAAAVAGARECLRRLTPSIAVSLHTHSRYLYKGAAILMPRWHARGWASHAGEQLRDLRLWRGVYELSQHMADLAWVYERDPTEHTGALALAAAGLAQIAA